MKDRAALVSDKEVARVQANRAPGPQSGPRQVCLLEPRPPVLKNKFVRPSGNPKNQKHTHTHMHKRALGPNLG